VTPAQELEPPVTDVERQGNELGAFGEALVDMVGSCDGVAMARQRRRQRYAIARRP